MPFCAVCGSPVEGRFCAKCGSPVGAPAAGPSGPGAPPPSSASAGLSENAASALCYLVGFLTGIIFLVLEPYSRNRKIRFHAYQSIFLSVAVIAVRWVLNWFLFRTMHVFSFLFVASLVSLACICIWLYMLIATYQGKTVVLPIIGPLAQQQVR
jgi:uncharacterized membrane protein